ncbi:hypothetical protein SAMN04489712_10524 [Thermomonospora echinospora]|uniref:P68 RBP/TagC-like beta-propeller domain-containing protein n=1 Tax=Thermomonospora echinospora TaxID=1992 RepID=A0A1H5ZVU5_9ACTN|nr:teichoic acid biosynthesis protein C [Thermomonospora echinospora]SEG40262.1 hypothetical protein SAMN04489712_10524 [Thermomonospora echinospora]
MVGAAPLFAMALVVGAGPAGGVGVAAAATGAVHPSDSRRFALTAPSHALFQDRRLKDGTVMQSFGFDIANGRLFTAQLKSGPWSDENGDLTISRLDLAGNLLGHMHLEGFGHGTAIGVESSGDASYLWVEVDPTGFSARGTQLARFKFVDGVTLTNESPELTKYQPVPDVSGVTATIDPVNGRLAMRYKEDGWRIAVYDLADLKAHHYDDPVFDIAQPSLGGETFQGYALYGKYLYTYSGNPYGPGNPPPGNARLSTIDLETGRRVEGPTLTTAGSALTFREPEGMAIHRTVEGEVRLFFGMASGEPGKRRANLFYNNALIGEQDGMRRSGRARPRMPKRPGGR